MFDEELGLLFSRAKKLGFDLEDRRQANKLFVQQMDAGSCRRANSFIAFAHASIASGYASSPLIASTATRPRCTSQPDRGTSIYIFLARAEGRQGMETPSAGAQAPAYVGGAPILLVDDDNAVREVTAAMLRDFGYVVHEVGGGGAALDFLEREQNIDLMLIDFAMPGMSGADVARRVHLCAPSLPTLFVTGFADRTALMGVSERCIIGKPFEPGELARKVRSALAERGPSNVVRFG